MLCTLLSFFLFFFNDTATTEIYTLSLHDALPIYNGPRSAFGSPILSRSILSLPLNLNSGNGLGLSALPSQVWNSSDRKSTRLNSSHLVISYAVFCLKKKNGQFHQHHSHKPTNHSA